MRTHDTLFLNRALFKRAGEDWSEDAIRSRTDELAGIVIDIWPVPAGHRSVSPARRSSLITK